MRAVNVALTVALALSAFFLYDEVLFHRFFASMADMNAPNAFPRWTTFVITSCLCAIMLVAVDLLRDRNRSRDARLFRPTAIGLAVLWLCLAEFRVRDYGAFVIRRQIGMVDRLIEDLNREHDVSKKLDHALEDEKRALHRCKKICGNDEPPPSICDDEPPSTSIPDL